VSGSAERRLEGARGRGGGGGRGRRPEPPFGDDQGGDHRATIHRRKGATKENGGPRGGAGRCQLPDGYGEEQVHAGRPC